MGNILFLYFQWHFIDGPRAIWKGWKDCLRFNLDYWSVPLLLKTLFSHWRRYRSSYGRGFDPGRWFNAFIFNAMSRMLGALARSILIFVGLITEFFVFCAGVAVFLIWILLPFLVIFGIYYGFRILF